MLLFSICLYLLINLAIGFWASGRINTTEDFVLAGRRLSFTLASMVTFATWFGSETMMGAPTHFIEGGFLAVIEEPFGAALCLIITGLFFARTFYNWNILTFCDFFQIRFGPAAEFVSAALMVPSYLGWIAGQLVAMGVVGEVLFGFSLQTGICVGATLVMIYTITGGMWSVSITDFLHNIILIIGLIVLAVILFSQPNTFSNMVAEQPKDFFRVIPKTHTAVSWFEYLAAWITIGLGSIPQQDIFQRVMAAKSATIAVKSSITAGFLYLTVALLPLFIALAAKTNYPELLQGDTKMIIPNMVLHHTPIAIQILFFGALISALLSTTSGAILAPASVLGENLIRPLLPKITNKELTDKQLLATIRGAVVVVTVAAIVMALARQDIFELVGESSAFSLVSLFVPLVAGLYWKRASLVGCVAAMVLGLGVWSWIHFISPVAFPDIIIGLAVSALAMLVGSLAFPNKKRLEV